jgi:hypothetical protein
MLPQYPCPSDPGPADDSLSPKMKVLLKGHKLHLAEEVKEALLVALKKVTGRSLKECFQH